MGEDRDDKNYENRRDIDKRKDLEINMKVSLLAAAGIASLIKAFELSTNRSAGNDELGDIVFLFVALKVLLEILYAYVGLR